MSYPVTTSALFDKYKELTIKQIDNGFTLKYSYGPEFFFSKLDDVIKAFGKDWECRYELK